MHISQVKEYNPESNHTDKTIQRSIYVSNPTLTNQYSTPTKFSNTMNFSQTKNSLKKSTSTIDPYSQNRDNTSYSFISTSSNNIKINPQTPYNKSSFEFKPINELQSYSIPPKVNFNNLKLSLAKSQNDSSYLNKQFYGQNKYKGESLGLQDIISKVKQELKENYLPQIIGSLKKEIYNDFQSLRFEISCIKDQQKNINQKLNHREYNEHNEPKKLQIQDNSLAQTYLFLLQQKVSKLQIVLNQKYEKLNQRFEKQMKSFSQKSFGISNIKSSIPNIKLQYKQSFTIKECSDKSKINEEIIVSLLSYNVDKFGYLLDSQNCYLLDKKGFQIRLQEKHMKMLEEYKILYK